MATMVNYLDLDEETRKNAFFVIHPLDDAPEKKVDTERLGPMPMTLMVRLSLLSLRGYLILMLLLVGYRALDMAGLFAPHAR